MIEPRAMDSRTTSGIPQSVTNYLSEEVERQANERRLEEKSSIHID
jgi:hypothetical protein